MDPHLGSSGLSSAASPNTVPSPAAVYHRPSAQPTQYLREKVERFNLAVSAGRKFHQIIGLREPEPFLRPPEVPGKLKELFLEGLGEYGGEWKGGRGGMGGGDGNMSINANSSMHVSGRSNEGKMEGIQEERGSGGVDRDGNKMMMPPPPPPPPVWNSHPQQVQSTAFYSKANPQNAVGSNTTNVPVPFSPYNGYQPATNIYPVRSASMPVSFVQVRPVPWVPVFGNGDRPVCQGNLTSKSLAQSMGTLPYNYNGGSQNFTSTIKNNGPQFNVPNAQGSLYQNAGSQTNLFPPPRVQGQSHNTSQHNTIHAAPSTHSNIHAPTRAPFNPPQLPPVSNYQFPNPPVPQIAIKPPSPTKKLLNPKKRAPSITSPTPQPPTQRLRPADTTTGLPILPANLSAIWKSPFPGNTPGLTTTMLHWSGLMQTLYRRYPSPKLFSLNPAFPYPVKPLLFQRLVSAAFYDTSVTPHREVRFFGPGDAKEIVYGEVDCFKSPASSDGDDEEEEGEDGEKGEEQEGEEKQRKFDIMKRIFGLAAAEQKERSYQPPHCRAATGEGRWAYVMVKGYAATNEETAPCLVIVWHISAITQASTCLHTIFPDDCAHQQQQQQVPGTETGTSFLPPQQQQQPSPSPLRRLASLQNLVTAAKQSVHIHKAIRCASSSASGSNIPPGTTPQGTIPQTQSQPQTNGHGHGHGHGFNISIPPQANAGAQTLSRTVIKLEKPGNIPLIEGYRVDVRKFRPWLTAVGKGQGKLVLWRERK